MRSRFRLFSLIFTTMLLVACSGRNQAQAVYVPHPDKAGARIEFFQERPATRGPWPVVVLLHGHQDASSNIGGRAFVDYGVLGTLAKRGYLAVSVSLPGYGGSSGPDDFAGPYTRRAVAAVIEEIRKQDGGADTKILIEGVSLGAVTAARLASEDQKIAGLVLISGLYDIPEYFSHATSLAALGVKASAFVATGGSDTALSERSALRFASRIKADTLILNGARDDRTDPDQALRLATAINSAGGHARAHIFADFGHAIPPATRAAEIDQFIDATLKR